MYIYICICECKYVRIFSAGTQLEKLLGLRQQQRAANLLRKPLCLKGRATGSMFCSMSSPYP